MKNQYLKCHVCEHENFVDPHSEIPTMMYTCDECGEAIGHLTPIVREE
jgi:uncharacterized protein YlaI